MKLSTAAGNVGRKNLRGLGHGNCAFIPTLLVGVDEVLQLLHERLHSKDYKTRNTNWLLLPFPLLVCIPALAWLSTILQAEIRNGDSNSNSSKSVFTNQFPLA